jgi:hypothetical protein
LNQKALYKSNANLDTNWKYWNTRIVKGEDEANKALAAKQAVDRDTAAVKKASRYYGISELDAASLIAYQEASIKAMAEQRQAVKWYEDNGYDPAVIPDIPDVKAALEWRKNAARMIDQIIGRGDGFGEAATAERLKSNRAAMAQQEFDRWYEKELDALFPAGANFKVDKLDLEPRLAELAGKLNEKLIDPALKFSNDLNDLSKIKDAGRISEDTFALAVGDLMKEAGAHLGAPQLASGVELGSQQLATMVARAGIGQGPQTVEGLLEALRKIAADNLNTAKQIAVNTGSKPPVVTAPE